MTRSVAVRLCGVVGLVAAVYAPTLAAPFCSYDDFNNELYRAAFTDAPNPSLVFTTSHFEGARYRPLNRGLTLVTFLAGNGRAVPFRVRNLVLHLICVVLVFALSSSLFRAPRAALWAALLFGVHPLANMTVVGAVNAHPLGHGFLLAALLLFLRGLRAASAGSALIVASLVAAGLGILTYESGVAYFPLTALLLLVEVRSSGRRPGSRVIVTWAGGSVALLAGYAALRALYVPAGKIAGAVAPLATAVKSLATYGGALFLPLDPVLLHDLLGTPYPSEFTSSSVARRGLGLVLLGGSAAAALILAVRAGRRLAPEARAALAPGATFAAMGVLVLLSPFFLFTKHASETYVYFPAAFVALLAGALFDAAGRTERRAAAVAGILLVALAAAATISRNLSVLRCGRAAERLVAGLKAGAGEDQSLLVANAPGEERSRRYGFYGFRGTDTVGDGIFANSSLSRALHLAQRKVGMAVAVVDSDELKRASCAPAETRKPTFWVRADGSVSVCICDAAKRTP